MGMEAQNIFFGLLRNGDDVSRVSHGISVHRVVVGARQQTAWTLLEGQAAAVDARRLVVDRDDQRTEPDKR